MSRPDGKEEKGRGKQVPSSVPCGREERATKREAQKPVRYCLEGGGGVNPRRSEKGALCCGA